jgi:hypothetical protein
MNCVVEIKGELKCMDEIKKGVMSHNPKIKIMQIK